MGKWSSLFYWFSFVSHLSHFHFEIEIRNGIQFSANFLCLKAQNQFKIDHIILLYKQSTKQIPFDGNNQYSLGCSRIHLFILSIVERMKYTYTPNKKNKNKGCLLYACVRKIRGKEIELRLKSHWIKRCFREIGKSLSKHNNENKKWLLRW